MRCQSLKEARLTYHPLDKLFTYLTCLLCSFAQESLLYFEVIANTLLVLFYLQNINLKEKNKGEFSKAFEGEKIPHTGDKESLDRCG